MNMKPRLIKDDASSQMQYDSASSIEDGDEGFEDGKLILGIDYPAYSSLPDLLQIAGANDVNFVCAPLFHPRLRRNKQTFATRTGTITRSDMALDRQDWVTNVIGLASPWIQFSPSRASQNEDSARALSEEYSYACHLGLQAFILPAVNLPGLVSMQQMMATATAYGCGILSSLSGGAPCNSSGDSVGAVISTPGPVAFALKPAGSTRVWVTVPIQYTIHSDMPQAQAPGKGRGGDGDDADAPAYHKVSGWLSWNAIRNAAAHHPFLSVVLDLSGVGGDQESRLLHELQIWRGEPVEAIIVHTSQFIWEEQQKAEAPGKRPASKQSQKARCVLALPRLLKSILRMFTDQRVQVILRGPAHVPPLATASATAKAQEHTTPPPTSSSANTNAKSSSAKGRHPPGKSPALPVAQSAKVSAAEAPLPSPPLREYLALLEAFWDEANAVPPTLYDKFCAEYQDSLRAPLQPLADHLDSETYTVMEQDPVKYAKYEEAIAAALRDQIRLKDANKSSAQTAGSASVAGGVGDCGSNKGSSSKSKAGPRSAGKGPAGKRAKREPTATSSPGWVSIPSPHTCATSRKPPPAKTRLALDDASAWTSCPVVRVLVAGPGRGPLIQAALSASEYTGVPVEITAVEKNPNAVITLRNRAVAEGWGSRVVIHCSDMRVWQPTEWADVLVSELLGSWGDNECSPECLDAVIPRCVRPGSGVSIPYRYTSFVAPVVTHKNWNAARLLDPVTGLETPYVVQLCNHLVLAAAQPIFTFTHQASERLTFSGDEVPPPNTTVFMNTRVVFPTCTIVQEEELEDTSGGDLLSARPSLLATMHGFSGYFDCALYKDIGFSTVPETFSTGMFSWFPMFIPLAQPLTVRCRGLLPTAATTSTTTQNRRGQASISSPAAAEPAEDAAATVAATDASSALSVDFWRYVSADKMWYEWQISSDTDAAAKTHKEKKLKVHNLNGSCSFVSL